MKKTITISILLFFFLISSIVAQNLEWNRQPSLYSSANCILPLEDGGWIIGGTVGEFYLIRIDSLGNSIWGDVGMITTNSLNHIEEMFFDTDTSFYIVGGSPPGAQFDIIIGGQRVLRRYSINGRLLFDYSDVEGQNVWYTNYFKAADFYSDQTVIVVTNDKSDTNYPFDSPTNEIIILNLDGSVEWNQPFENLDFYDVIAYADGSFNAASSEGIMYFDENKNNTFTALESKPIYQIEKYQNNFTLARTKDELYLLDADLQISDVFTSEEIDSIAHFYFVEDEIFLTGKDTTTHPFVLRLNENLEQQFYFTFGNTSIFPNAIIAKGDKIGVSGKIFTNPNYDNVYDWNYSSMFFKTFTKEGISIDYNEDVGITDIEVGSANAKFIYQDYYQLELKNVNITIENLGEDTLNEVKINMFEGTFGDAEKLFNLQIPPGESFRTSLGQLNWSSFLENGNPEFEFCLWTSVPDGKIDINPSNDRMCKTVEFEIEEMMPPFIPEDFPILFPNPATTTININPPTPNFLYDLRILNSVGQEIDYQKIGVDWVGSIYPLDISQLSRGVYFINLKYQEESYVFPFVKM